MNSTQYICTEDDNYKRIDYLLENLVEKMGLRGRRRLCEQGRIFINNKKAKASDKVRVNNIITINSPEKDSLDQSTLQQNSLVSIIKEDANYAAVYKPAQMHSEKLSGTITNNIQDKLAELFIDKNPILLNRLDFATSGIIMIAFSTEAEEQWKLYQSNKKTEKTYLALVEGKLENDINITRAILLKNKHSVQINKSFAGTRHTHVRPLAHAKDKDNNDISLVSCVITHGARHQIRAHLASIGHPLINDIKYNATKPYTMEDLTKLSMLQSPFVIYDVNSRPNRAKISSAAQKQNHRVRDNSLIFIPLDDLDNIQAEKDLQKKQKTHDINEVYETEETHDINEVHETEETHDINEVHETEETHAPYNALTHNVQVVKNEEYFMLHHVKVEFSLFETVCLPNFWELISPDLQKHILARI